MKWFLVTFKDGSRVETLAPHHRSIRKQYGPDAILFIREITDEPHEKTRYYNPDSKQGKPQCRDT
jgi:hypothetical protein